MSINNNNNTVNSVGSDLTNGRAQNIIVDSNAKSQAPSSIQLQHVQPLNRNPIQKPVKLNNNFNLEEQFSKAYNNAINFANKVLLDDNLSMTLKGTEKDIKAVVTDTKENSIIQEYNPVEVLQMYSSNYNLQGLVIDAFI